MGPEDLYDFKTGVETTAQALRNQTKAYMDKLYQEVGTPKRIEVPSPPLQEQVLKLRSEVNLLQQHLHQLESVVQSLRDQLRIFDYDLPNIINTVVKREATKVVDDATASVQLSIRVLEEQLEEVWEELDQ